MPSRCRMPRLIVLIWEAARSASPTSPSSLVAVAAAALPGDPKSLRVVGEPLLRGLRGRVAGALGEDADAPADLDGVGVWDAGDGEGSRVRLEDRAEHADRRGLARAVRPEEAQDRAAVHREVQRFHGHGAVVRLPQTVR